MTTKPAKIVVAGHICLDIIPTFPSQDGESTARIEPGRLYLMGPAVCATGGAVSNTGLALHRLGVPTTLMGKVGEDLFGGEVLNILRRQQPHLADGMIVTAGESTSYSIVINPPHVDRAFLHCPGANDTFDAEDVDFSCLAGARLFHFGYPPIMQRFYSDGGAQMSTLLRKVGEQGLLTSLDMAMPDPQSRAGRVDWQAWLKQVLPWVDVFLPSIDETLFMLHRDLYDQLSKEADGDISQAVDAALLRSLSDQLLAMGASVVVLKLGEQGLYLRTATIDQRLVSHLQGEGKSCDAWNRRELLAPCFQVDVTGTTGAGDCTIAGFLAALADRASPVEALTRAVAVGACSVEAADASSGIRPWPEVQQRIDSGWPRCSTTIRLSDWSWVEAEGVWTSSNDSVA